MFTHRESSSLVCRRGAVVRKYKKTAHLLKITLGIRVES